MKKICVLQNSLTYGGTDIFVLNLCSGLVEDGYEVTVVLSIDEETTCPRLKDLKNTGVKIAWTCSLNSITGKVKHLCMLYNILRTGQFGVFHTNIDLFNGPNLFVAWLAKVPIRICHSHNTKQGKEVREGRSFKLICYQKLMRWLCWKFSNRRTGCSEDALNFLFMSKWKQDYRAKVIHNGIDLNKYCVTIDRKLKRNSLGITRKYVISTVGRIDDQKNPEFLIEVFYELFNIRDDVELLWCGTGELENRVSEKISDYQIQDCVHLLGQRSDVNEILSVSDLFLLPSRFEGLGIVLVEAQASGLPCVMSDVIPKEANCGACYSISLGQPATYWAQIISDILDEKITLSVDGAKLYRFSTECMVKEMEEVFE